MECVGVKYICKNVTGKLRCDSNYCPQKGIMKVKFHGMMSIKAAKMKETLKTPT